MSTYSPVHQSDHLFQGEDKTLTFAVVDSAGSPVNAGGFATEWTLYSSGGTKELTKTSAAGQITYVNVAGTQDGVRVAIDDEDTISAAAVVLIKEGLYYHELWRVDEGSEQMLAYGDVLLLAAERRT